MMPYKEKNGIRGIGEVVGGWQEMGGGVYSLKRRPQMSFSKEILKTTKAKKLAVTKTKRKERSPQETEKKVEVKIDLPENDAGNLLSVGFMFED